MKSYSFLNTIVLVNGNEINEWAEGDDVITAERRSDSATDVMTADGVMIVSMSTDRSGVFGFNLMQTSASNAYLSGLIGIQENGVFVPAFVQFKDTFGNDYASGTQGYIRKIAPLTRGVATNPQKWEIVVERLDLVLGGS